ncbi:transposase [Rhodococcus koreensis]|uniref:transposase n=1 Tax=Rhodococcus koreensis TaxID=99653 RepID=UPI0036733586
MKGIGDLVPGAAVPGEADLTDAQWARLAPLLPRVKKAGRPPKCTKWQLIAAIRTRRAVNCGLSPRRPAVTTIDKRLRPCSQAGCVLVVHPLPECPNT